MTIENIINQYDFNLVYANSKITLMVIGILIAIEMNDWIEKTKK